MKLKKIAIGIATFLLCLELTIVLHELGHYAVAKSCGVYCPEFTVGIGPSVTLAQTGETEWKFGLFPVMGGVSMLARDANDGDEVMYKGRVVDGRTLDELSRGELLMVAGAGVLVNFLLGIGAFVFLLRLAPKKKRPDLLQTAKMIVNLIGYSAYYLFLSLVTFGRYPAVKVSKKELEERKALEAKVAELNQEAEKKGQKVEYKIEEVESEPTPWFVKALALFGSINLTLGIFNLLPIMGLDGFWIFSAILGIDIRTAMSWIPENFVTYFVWFTVIHAIIYWFMPRKVVIVDDTATPAEAKA